MGRTSDAESRLIKAITELIWCGSYGSTTIDQICEKAKVNKGTFYHFFKSKSALAVAAIRFAWMERQLRLNQIFSPLVSPLERLKAYCLGELKEQEMLRKTFGFVLGCPLCTLGTEVSTRDERLRQMIEEVLEGHRKYIASAIREAKVLGEIQIDDIDAVSRRICALYEGLITQARIANNLAMVKEAWPSTLALLNPSLSRSSVRRVKS